MTIVYFDMLIIRMMYKCKMIEIVNLSEVMKLLFYSSPDKVRYKIVSSAGNRVM